MIKILIVDDKTENIYLLQSMLDTNGFKTISAKNGAEALGLLRTILPDLIITDILMPVMDGFTLCRECKKDEILKNIPFFFYTATYIDAKDEEYALSLGADRFILKPQEPDVFLKLITDFLEEVRRNNIHPKDVIYHDETVVLKEYNEVLIRKIEDKMLQTEKAEKELRRYSEELEKEILERKKNEAFLQKSQNLFQTLAEISPVGIFRTTPDGSTTYVNPRWSELSGLTLKEAEGNGWLNAVHPDDREIVLEYWKSNILSQKPSDAEYRFLHKDNSVVWVIGNAVPELIDNKTIGYVGTITDNTERKLAEKTLQESEERYHRIFENVQDLYYETSMDGTVLEVSPSIQILSHNQYTREDLIGKSMFGFYSSSEDRLSFLSALEKKGKVNDFEVTLRNKDGSLIPCSISAKISVDQQGKPEKIIGSMRDISERKLIELDLINAKDKAEESDRLKTAFLHNISHEIRTPMNAIVGFSDLILDPDLESETRNDFLHTIVESSNQLLSIITQIVSMATLEAGQEKIYEKELSLNSILKILFDQFHSEAVKKNISLKYKTSLRENEDIIKTDETKLIQIISNLLGNAIKFTKKGSIDYGYVIKNKYLEFYIKDTGIGIPEDMHEIIFERFRQVETTLARDYEGSGLGLSISKAYVELLGGKIWLTSNLGEGSVFYFTITYNKVSLNRIQENGVIENYRDKLKKTLTLLVAEDEINNFKLLEFYLSNINILVIHAANGSEAVEICKTNKQINLVLMDLKMPVMDGFEATKRIKEFWPDLPIIAQTAYVRDFDKTKAIASGCIDFISKPFKKEELLTMIREHLVFD
jgi:PAS domain S-box-containing protein